VALGGGTDVTRRDYTNCADRANLTLLYGPRRTPFDVAELCLAGDEHRLEGAG
jgi:hypothetical protein